MVIFWNAPPVSVSDSHVVLRLGVSVFSSFQEPLSRFTIVSAHSPANRVKRTDVVLCFRVAFFSSHEEPPKSFCIVLRYSGPAQVCICNLELCIDVSLVCLSGERRNVIRRSGSSCRLV